MPAVWLPSVSVRLQPCEESVQPISGSSRKQEELVHVSTDGRDAKH